MKNLKIVLITIVLQAYFNISFCQTQSNIEEHNWKVEEIYVDSVLMVNETLFLRFSSGGTLMSDTLQLIPSTAQYQQRSVSGDTYLINDTSMYNSSAQNSIEFTQNNEIMLWDIIHEDLNTLILFKYDTISGNSMQSRQPYIYPVELRLVKNDF